MRVIAGRAGGLRLQSPKGLATRPTADRVKESLFSILSPYLAGAAVLDLYAGSGALGIEALSRGANRALFVDHSSQAAAVIRRNLTHTGFADSGEVWCCAADRAIKRLARETRTFDVIFADPPYNRGLAAATVLKVGEGALLSPNGWLVVEHSLKEEMPAAAQNLILQQQRTYGDTAVTLFRPLVSTPMS